MRRLQIVPHNTQFNFVGWRFCYFFLLQFSCPYHPLLD